MCRRACFVCWMLLGAVVLPAQNRVVVTDTVITTVQLSEEDTGPAGLFDSLGQILPVNVRPVPQRLIDSLKGADDFWYAALERKKSKAPEQKEMRRGSSLFREQWFRNLLWAVILGSFCGVVLWYLISSNILLFRKKAKPVGDADDADSDTDNIFERDYEKEIDAAASAGNFRLAVRLLYLRTLRSLSAAGLIDYRFGRTNQDYVADLRSQPQHPAFARLTRHFEYVWYGQFPLSAEAFQNLQADFTLFQNSLPT